MASVAADFDGDVRPIGAAPDVGADEWGISSPAAVTNLRVSQAITATGIVTATLRWTPPPEAITTTLRYSRSLITIANWNKVAILNDSLPGNTGVFTATVPYTDGSLYFALRTWNGGGASAVSNNGFWPQREIYLPVIFRAG